MIDNTPSYLKLLYQAWFDSHPEAQAEIGTTTVREQKRPGGATEYVKNTSRGEVKVTKEEFDARYWARERGIHARTS